MHTQYTCTPGETHCRRQHGPLIRYVELRVAQAPGMPGTITPPPRVGDPDMHHGTCVTHVLWCMPGSLTSGFLSSGWREKRSRHSRRMRNPQFCVSGKRPMIIGVFPLQVCTADMTVNHISTIVAKWVRDCMIRPNDVTYNSYTTGMCIIVFR